MTGPQDVNFLSLRADARQDAGAGRTNGGRRNWLYLRTRKSTRASVHCLMVTLRITPDLSLPNISNLV
jgi:hypothetical protein